MYKIEKYIKIDKNQVFTVKWNELEKRKNELDEVSGLYFYHVNNKLKYVGLSDNLWNRFNGGYLKEDTKQHINPKLMQLITSNSSVVEVIFAPLDKYLLKEQETLWIHEYIPEFNEKENPRYEIHPIQKVIGRIVNSSNKEWSFNEMREYLFNKWWGKVSYERIDEALANKQFHLSNYCKTSQKKKTLKSKKKKTA
ncbi:hypothetical protein [Peribacillus frigoritolerans]|uniref:hypothetical protein n=1 Tax=Peribacillus frigoritolerans TaxID=450367 RepID=UPI00207A5EDF|nr:hypothetical protein [Peribacillus frigoritolerans]USK64853.1 hypothetical protein LIT26_27750 [Peribacillus frigoritolerans]